MDNREKFRTLHREFGLEEVLSDPDSAGSYLRDMGFQRKEVNFLRMICSPENRHLRKRILDREADLDAVVERISDDTGYDRTFIAGFVKDIRAVYIVEKKTLVFSNGRYEEDFVDDKRTGKGTYYWADGRCYEGDFNEGRCFGTGKYTKDTITYTGSIDSSNGRTIFNGVNKDGFFKKKIREELSF